MNIGDQIQQSNINNQNNSNNNPPDNRSFLQILKEFISSNFTFIFVVFLLINITVFILSSLDIAASINYAICEWPLRYKSQYYRLITHHFFHAGVVHILFNMIVFFQLCPQIEKRIGSLYTFIYLLNSIFTVSLTYMIIIKISNLFLVIINSSTNLDSYCSVGFSAIIFDLLYFNYNFTNEIANRNSVVFGIALMKNKYLPLFYLVAMQLLNPDASFVGHLSGIISGILIKNLIVYLISHK